MPRKSRGKERKSRKIEIALVILTIAFLSINVLFLLKNNILQVKEIDSSIIVSDKMGFDVNSSIIAFGMAVRGSGSIRTVNFINVYNHPIEVDVYGKGEMSDFITSQTQKFGALENISMRITAQVPSDKPLGQYQGKVVFVIKKL